MAESKLPVEAGTAWAATPRPCWVLRPARSATFFRCNDPRRRPRYRVPGCPPNQFVPIVRMEAGGQVSAWRLERASNEAVLDVVCRDVAAMASFGRSEEQIQLRVDATAGAAAFELHGSPGVPGSFRFLQQGSARRPGGECCHGEHDPGRSDGPVARLTRTCLQHAAPWVQGRGACRIEIRPALLDDVDRPMIALPGPRSKGQLLPTSLAKVSRKPTVRLNTGRSAVESGSSTK